MNKRYNHPEFEVTRFYTEDVIATSSGDFEEYTTEVVTKNDGWTDFH